MISLSIIAILSPVTEEWAKKFKDASSGERVLMLSNVAYGESDGNGDIGLKLLEPVITDDGNKST